MTMHITVYAVPGISLSDSFAKPGEIANLTISYRGEQIVTSLQFDINYDVSLVTSGDILKGNAASNHLVRTRLFSPGFIRIVIYSYDGSLLDNGSVVQIPFTLNSSFTGRTNVSIDPLRLADDGGEVVSSIDVKHGTLSAAFDFSIQVFEGWNLISFRLSPNVVEPHSLFGNTLTSPAWGWSNTSEHRNIFNTVSRLSSQKGYWLKLSEGGMRNLTGNIPESSSFIAQPGWNLLGVSEQISYPDNPSIKGGFGLGIMSIKTLGKYKQLKI